MLAYLPNVSVAGTYLSIGLSDEGAPLFGAPPPNAVRAIRPSGRSCGSGSYYRSVKRPYLEEYRFKDQQGNDRVMNSDGYLEESNTDSGGTLYTYGCCGYTTPNIDDSFSRNDYTACDGNGMLFIQGKQRWETGRQNMNWVSCQRSLFIRWPGESLPSLVVQSFFGTQRDSGHFDYGIGTANDPASITRGAIYACARAGLNMSFTRENLGVHEGVFYDERTDVWVTARYSLYDLSHNIRYGLIDPPHQDWLFDQDDDGLSDFLSIVDLGIIPGSIKNALGLACVEATDQLPEVSANSLMNVLELASSLRSVTDLIRGGGKALKSSVLGAAKSALDPRQDWLTWRYVYNTTKMDLEEYKHTTNRLIQLVDQPTFAISGRATSDDGIKVKVTEHVDTGMFALDTSKAYGGKSARELLKQFGFKLSAYNVWDMIPYSFMVDWFIPVGDILSMTEKWSEHQQLRTSNVWASASKQLPHGYYYYRWANHLPTQPPVYKSHPVSDKTITYRIADTISIFSGR